MTMHENVDLASSAQTLCFGFCHFRRDHSPMSGGLGLAYLFMLIGSHPKK